MTKAERLLQIIRILHTRKYAVTARELADEFGVSLRSVYRDIAALGRQGIPIEGEAGVGYILRKGYTLPPLMFTAEEIEALMVGARWVASAGDEALVKAAMEAMRKIKDVVPAALRLNFNKSALIVGYQNKTEIDKNLLQAMREATKKNLKVSIKYKDGNNNKSERIIWPIALGYFDDIVVIAAWCELRNGFRHFRADRIITWSKTYDKYPVMHNKLFQEWLKSQSIDMTSDEI